MAKVIAHELEILGSHGMQAHRYGAMLDMVRTGKLAPEKLVGKKIHLQQSIDALMNMDKFEVAGVTVAAPVVLEGDITLPGLGLSAEAAAWAARNCDELIHSAASLSFQMRDDGEPMRSNVGGTANVLEFCRTSGIRRLHHVSSA